MAKTKKRDNTDFCVKLVRYGRTQMVGNEAQLVILSLAALSCYAPDAQQYVNTIVMGESGSGKTKLVKSVMGEGTEESHGLMPFDHVKHLTSGSPKAMVYSDDLCAEDSTVKLILFAELQKLEKEHIEFMKGLSGDDNEFVYEFVDMAHGGTQQIHQPKRNYILTFAQVNILDKELQTRLLLIPVEENRLINECVIDMKFDAETLSYKGREYNFVSDEKLIEELQARVQALALGDPVECYIPFGKALHGLVNSERPESKRHAQMIAALLKSSARLNYVNRKRDKKDRVIVSAQDIVNVLSAYDIIQATMTGIDIVDLAMWQYMAGVGEDINNRPRKRASDIIRRVADLGIGEMTVKEFERRIQRLINENYVFKSVGDSRETEPFYAVNPMKVIESPTVDWELVCEYDSSEVIDPVTERKYHNIIEYGEILDNRKMSKRLLNAVAEGLDPNSLQAKIRCGVAQVLSADIPYTELSQIASATKIKLSMKALEGHQEVHDEIQRMVDDGIVYHNEGRGVYLLRDPTIFGNTATRGEQQKWGTTA